MSVPSKAQAGPAVVAEHLRKSYGSTVAVDDVSFDVAPGEILGILGPNGAGKTTTVEMVAGLRTPEAGRVEVHGIEPWSDRRALTRIVGVQLQESELQPQVTVKEALDLWAAFYDDPADRIELAERLGLSDHLGQRFTDLSGGQQQRLSIALALIGRPKVAILDELSTGLDPRARRDVWQLVREVREKGATILLVTHSMEEAQVLCDRVAIVDSGRVRALDTPDGLVRAAARATVTSFEAAVPVDLQSLRELPGVTTVRSEGGRITVEGADGAAVAVLGWLERRRITPRGLRVVEGTLDSAYLDLTTEPLEPLGQEGEA